ncbi:hypothetical protein TraAM80_02433 [Trypanosoma rangeli]|uniref:Uncharacterized protein n=1 Tax=Trypanosoma rangeli TaxID=5698 RepID=A0A3R7L7B9_TRYRA|nr:uncharacterized protein TraAM80_02433 [Trypanosoma rangeli]RNF09036.1 hypothetical protein TraAM80_02433 [Trypanosoma rangeli]|eukprot:RNF09036.1 hypothetical protein TraAM80_02433 [Trypanosoma rangeli]
MNPSGSALSDAEQYSIWCEQVRDLFTSTGTGKGIEAASTEAEPLGEGSSVEDGGEFSHCFYMRMLSSGKEEAMTHGMNDTLQSCSSGLGSDSGSDRSDYVSSAAQLKGRQIFIDEDALAMRLASKLSAHARKLRREHDERHPEVPQVSNNQWSFRDGKVEAIACKMNEELHELLMYVRRQNLLAQQLHRQLVQSKQLILQQKQLT